MKNELIKLKTACRYPAIFIKWAAISGVIGLAGGAVGSIFHISVDEATSFREENPWLIWFLPLGGLVIAALYRVCKMQGDTGTDRIISSVRCDEKVPALIAPLIFIGTVITHLFGGSAGREGAALQLGGSLGYQTGKFLRLDDKDMHLITLCGMSAVFSALFGTPLTAAVFALEVISVGVIYYSGLVPCLFSSLVAYALSLLFKIKPVRFKLAAVPELSVLLFAKLVALAILCAVVSVVFCVALHKTNQLSRKYIKNDYIGIAAGGILVAALAFLLGTADYNGAGIDMIARAMGGEARPEAFLLKILFTAITIGVGFRGGEIIPAFFIGATFGCTASALLGIDPCFGAAAGFVALFCGVVNCPIASIILSIEVFGAEGILPFAVVCSVTNMLSGNYGLYRSQKIVYSKLKAEYINQFAK